MKTRSTASITLMSFIVFLFSCTSIKRVNPDSLSKTSRIKKIEKKSGQIIEFSKTGLGQIYEDTVVGKDAIQKAPEYISIPVSEIVRAWVEQPNPLMTLLSACLVAGSVLVFLLQVTKSATYLVGGR